MPSLNFKKQFVPIIESGKKRQTIREDVPFWAKLKRHSQLYLFTGLRTKGCKVIKVNNIPDVNLCYNDKNYGVTCKSVEAIKIHKEYDVEMNGNFLRIFEMEELAKADGFESAKDMFAFFKKEYGLPFEGVLIKW